jgi:glycosyltransferase involved in cell wall biosynthesis
MRLCLIGDVESIHIKRWSKWMIDRGHEVFLISDVKGSIEGCTVIAIGNPKKGSMTNFLRKGFQARRIVKGLKPDLVHGHYLTGPGFFGAFSGFHPLVVSAWGSDLLLDARRSRLKRTLIRWVIRKADLLHLEMKMEIDVALSLGAKKEKIIIAPFGVVPSLFSPDRRDEGLRTQMNSKEGPLVISTRNHEDIYDIQTLIRSVPLILKNAPDAQFLILGSGSQTQKLIDLAASEGVSGSVTFVGKVKHEELPKYLASSDVFISTSLSDTVSVSLLEAMSSGAVPVVSDIEGNRSLVRDQFNGFLFKTGAHTDLAEKVSNLLRDIQALEMFRTRNREIIMGEYDWNKNMMRIEEKYIDLMGVNK